MSKENKKSAGEKKPAKSSKAAASKVAAKSSASATAAKRPKAVQKKPAAAVEPSAPAATKPAAKPAAKPVARPAAKKTQQSTKILVRANIGFGNQIFIRGEGPGLSWDHGVPMECKDSDQWHWSADGVKEAFAFKVLINDQLWSHGENEQVKPGETKVVEPAF